MAARKESPEKVILANQERPSPTGWSIVPNIQLYTPVFRKATLSYSFHRHVHAVWDRPCSNPKPHCTRRRSVPVVAAVVAPPCEENRSLTSITKKVATLTAFAGATVRKY